MRAAFKRLLVGQVVRSPQVVPSADPTEEQPPEAQSLRRSARRLDLQLFHHRADTPVRLPFAATITIGTCTAEGGIPRIPVPGTQRVGGLERLGARRVGIPSELG